MYSNNKRITEKKTRLSSLSCMPGQWLISVQKFQLGPVGPGANSNCVRKKKGVDLKWPLTYLCDWSLFGLTTGRLLCAPDTLCCPLFTLFDPSASSVFFCQNSLCPWRLVALLLPLYLNRTECSLHLHRERESIWGCWPEAEDFGTEALSVWEQQVLEHHGQKAELSTSGKSKAALDRQHRCVFLLLT